ncbi:hypothetical protein [Hymenobacter lucidus]|uniref:Peptidase M4 domain-containing protein n=1 Tax=Hymenobacter lucidus TaxID=2880930 RepID=A0ABS8ASQ4_9BACT|nr:hypothetical protein [Hymenobacter lucidus]MCB2409240.1 hypothetical protein [Hymenobacter lucidus]
MAKSPKKSSGTAEDIQCWSTDPRDALPIRRAVSPALPGATLGIHITGLKPNPQLYSLGTIEFRYWTAAEALRRAADYWNAAGCKQWQSQVGKLLQVNLDAGNDLNAYYSREDKGLSFFHATITDASNNGRAMTVYSGESPDVISHELGHAILDAIKPELWDILTGEVAAFHEFFGDGSSILTALQLPYVRDTVVAETQGQLWRNSSIARMAEELGYAIRQVNPKYADLDCLRNASTLWLYRSPTELSPDGPNSILTSQPHNFSRVFTGAFLAALGRMALAIADDQRVNADHVLQASLDMGPLLLKAVINAPLRTDFYRSVAEQMIIAASQHLTHGEAYVKAITAAMIRQGILSTPDPVLRAKHTSFASAVAFAAVATDPNGVADATATQPAQLTIPGDALGLTTPLLVEGPAVEEQEKRRPVGISPMTIMPSSREQAIQSYVESLARRGRIAVDASVDAPDSFLHQVEIPHHATHVLETTAAGNRLRRIRVDCGGGFGW